MSDDIERLTVLIQKATEDIGGSDIRAEGFSPEFAELAQSIVKLLADVREMYIFESALADGDLSVPVPGRHNYFAGPMKDLYYKLKHLTWQAGEVAKGDYSQRVDFLGEFSESFNFMITELEKRERQVQEQAEEKVRTAERQNAHLRKEMEIQMSHYQAYRDYVKSFVEFRTHYKLMMGDVFELFRQGKYEEGRLLIADINDRMASEVVISRDYSNNDFVDAAMIEIADACRKRGIEFSGIVYIPSDFAVDKEEAIEHIIDYSELAYSLMDIAARGKRKMMIKSNMRNCWLSIVISYYAEIGTFPEEMDGCLPEESRIIIAHIREEAEKSGCFLNANYDAPGHKIEILLHICGTIRS